MLTLSSYNQPDEEILQTSEEIANVNANSDNATVDILMAIVLSMFVGFIYSNMSSIILRWILE